MSDADSLVALERIAAAHWRGTEEEWLGDWLLRAAEGFTGRANSVLPLGDPRQPLDAALAAVTRWYRDRGLRPMVVVPAPLESGHADASPSATAPFSVLDRLLTELGWQTREDAAYVMVADLPLGVAVDALPPGRAVRLSAEPDAAWAARYHYRGQDFLPPVALKVLTSAAEQSMLSIREAETVLAIARLSMVEGWAGITAVEVDPDYRRQGLGVAITAAACAQAQASGISRAFLQVAAGNTAARALYERLGFRYSHRYHYRMAPD